MNLVSFEQYSSMPSALIITTYSRVNFIPYAAKDEDALLPSSTMTVKLSSLSDDFITFLQNSKVLYYFRLRLQKIQSLARPLFPSLQCGARTSLYLRTTLFSQLALLVYHK